MQGHALSLDALFAMLPHIPEAESLRQRIMAASVPDPALAWTNASAYSTVDKRVIATVDLKSVLEQAELASVERVRRFHATLAEAVNALVQGDEAAVAERLITLGDQAASAELQGAAAACFETAVSVAAARSDPALKALTLRKLARARAATGDVATAASLYRASHEQASAADDHEACITALLGTGNMLTVQGRWREAGELYHIALTHATHARAQLRGQALINLSIIARETGDHDGAAAWLERAEALWSDLTVGDRSVWYNNLGLLQLARGEYEAAGHAFESALNHADSDYDRAMICDNVAELMLRQRRLDQAEAAGRRAEAYALSSGSPRALAEVYVRLGKVFRLRGDANGVTFFEKALEICRGRTYTLIEAQAYYEYGLFRRLLGDVDEARSFVAQAQTRYRELGSYELAEHAAALLSQLQSEAGPGSP